MIGYEFKTSYGKVYSVLMPNDPICWQIKNQLNWKNYVQIWCKALPLEVQSVRHPAKVPEETLRAPEFPSGAFHIYESIHDDGEKEVEECKEDN